MRHKGFVGVAGLAMLLILALSVMNNVYAAHVHAHGINAETNYLNNDVAIDREGSSLIDHANTKDIERMIFHDMDVETEGVSVIIIDYSIDHAIDYSIDHAIDRDDSHEIDNPNLNHFAVHRLSIDPADRNQAARANLTAARANLNKTAPLNRITVFRQVSLEVY